MYHKIIFVAVIVGLGLGLGLINSVSAFDKEHTMKAALQADSYSKSFENLMFACVDLTKAEDWITMDKCSNVIDKFNVVMNQFFITSKSDMDEILKKAIDSQNTGVDNSTPHYNYPRPQ